MASKPSTSNSISNVISPMSKPRTDGPDVETMRLLKRLVQKCIEEKRSGIFYGDLSNYYSRAERYTGLHPDTLKMLKENENILVELKVDRNDVHNELMRFILTENKLPTTKQLFSALQGTIPPYIDIQMFRNKLVKMNYIWKMIPRYTLVVMERPKVTFERYHYLKKIIQYRKERRPIYFIDENIISANGDFLKLAENIGSLATMSLSDKYKFVIYAVSNTGVHFVKYLDEYGEKQFETWLQEDFLMGNAEPSVVILNNNELNTKVIKTPPTINSLKEELIDWLEYHDVPCNINMPKLDLYNLVQKYTNTKIKFRVDEIITLCDNHVVLRVPESIRNLTMATLVHDLIDENLSKHLTKINSPFTYVNEIKRILISIPKNMFQGYGEYIAKEENSMLTTDLKVDEIFDSLVETMSTNFKFITEDEDSDVPTFSDSE